MTRPEIIPAGDPERVETLLGPLDYPGAVFGVGRSEAGGSVMPDIARR